MLKKLWKNKEEEKPTEISLKQICDYCKKEFLLEDLHHILEGNNVSLILCENCLNEFFGKGSLPIDEREEEEFAE